MTIQSITSDQQKQFRRFVEDASNRALKEINLDKNGLQCLLEQGGEFQAHIVAGIKRFTANAPDYLLARIILGWDFIPPDKITKSCKGLVYTDDQLKKLFDTLPSQEILEWCRDNDYMVVAGPPIPMSLLKIRNVRFPHLIENEAVWYENENESFAFNDIADTQWIILRKTAVPESASKTWGEQRALLSNNEIVPNAAEVAWCVTAYGAVRGIYKLKNICVRTSSIDSEGHRVLVGYFDASRLHVGYWSDDFRDVSFGVASARKLD